MKNYFRLSNAAIVVAFASLSFFATGANASFVELGQAGQFAALTTYIGTHGPDVGIGSEATTITGDVGLGPYSGGSAIKATINGNLFVDTNSHTDIHSDLHVTGTIFFNQNLAGAVADAFSASNFFAGLAPMQTYGNIGGAFTFNGIDGRNVIAINSVNTHDTLTINGSANSQFVFNISSGFILNGGSIVLTGGVTADNILFNLNGAGEGVTLNKPVGFAYGTFLAPQRDIILDKATLIGAVIGGGDGRFVIHSGATLINPIPEVSFSGLWIGFAGLICAFHVRRRWVRAASTVSKRR